MILVSLCLGSVYRRYDKLPRATEAAEKYLEEDPRRIRELIVYFFILGY